MNITGRSIYREDRKAGRDALSESMMSYWAAFAYTGDDEIQDKLARIANATGLDLSGG